jgi:hypothetical protein
MRDHQLLLYLGSLFTLSVCQFVNLSVLTRTGVLRKLSYVGGRSPDTDLNLT